MHIVILAWLPVALTLFPTCRIMSPRQSLLPLQTPTHFAAPEAAPRLPFPSCSLEIEIREGIRTAMPGWELQEEPSRLDSVDKKRPKGPSLPACLSFRPTRPPFLSSIICP